MKKIILTLAVLIYLGVGSAIGLATHVIGNKVQCPVMKKYFIPTEKTPKAEHKGKIYLFCCEGCKPKFLEDPEKYVSEISTKSDEHAGHSH